MKKLKVMMMTLMMCLVSMSVLTSCGKTTETPNTTENITVEDVVEVVPSVVDDSKDMVSFGQDRVNREKLSFLDKSNQLTTAVGWSYNKTLGEWVDYNNVIENDKVYKEKYKSLQGSYMMSHRKQNFISIQTKTLVFKDIKYYVVLVKKWNGDYKYPNISEDWREYKTMYGYIFTETEYNKLNNIDGVINLETQYMVSMGSYYEKYDEVVFLDKIQTELISKKSKNSTLYTFPINKIENGNIRFYVPCFFIINKVDFDKEYFETTFDNFSKFIIK